MSQHDAVTIRCWQLTGETALEDMVLGVDERAVRDGSNVLSSDDFDACLAIVVCRMGPNVYAHLSQVSGHYKGDASGIWDRSRGSGAPEVLIGPDSSEGIAVSHRVAVMHFLLDMG